jgi:hypothetical protein
MTPEEQDKHWRNQFDVWKAEQEVRRPMFEAGMRYAELAIKSLILVSGGAAVALAGFAGGSLKADAHPMVLLALSSSVWWFALSAVGAVAVAGLAYLSQIAFIEAPEPSNWQFDQRSSGALVHCLPRLFHSGRVRGVVSVGPSSCDISFEVSWLPLLCARAMLTCWCSNERQAPMMLMRVLEH